MNKNSVGKGGRALMIAVGISMLALLYAGVASATTHTVCLSGCDFTSIQVSINDVNTIVGDTIEVQSGTYQENVFVNNSLYLEEWIQGRKACGGCECNWKSNNDKHSWKYIRRI